MYVVMTHIGHFCVNIEKKNDLSGYCMKNSCTFVSRHGLK